MTTDFNGGLDEVNSVVVQPDGKIVVAGFASSSSSFTFTTDKNFALARYNSDGSLDTSFGTGGKVTTDFNGNNDEGQSVLQQSDGKFVVAGYAKSNQSDNSRNFALVRYNSDGSFDTSFGAGGKVTTDFNGLSDIGYSITQQSDGKLVVTGETFQDSSNNDFALARYNSDGSLDTSFGTGGKATTDFDSFAFLNDGSSSSEIAYGVAQQSDGNFIVVGSGDLPVTKPSGAPDFVEVNFAVARYIGSAGSAPVNTAPVANLNKTLTLLENASPTSLGITAPTDADGNPLTLIVNSIPDAAKGEIRLSDGTAVQAGTSLTVAQLSTLVFSPVLNANGSGGSFSYTVSDGQGGTATQAVTFSITPVNDAPVIEPNKTLTVLEDSAPSPLGIKAPTDADGDTLSIAVTSIPDATKGQIRLSDGTVVAAGSALTLDQLTNLVFVPIANRSLDAGSFAYTVNDGNGGTATQAVTFSITPVNDAPVIEPDKTLTVLEDSAPSPLGITAPTDVDGDTLSIAVTSIPDATKGQIRLSDGTVVAAGSALTLDQLTNLVFAPIANRSLDAGSFAYTVNDGNGGIVSQTVSLFITPDNDGGSIGDPHLITLDGLHYDFQATGDFVLVRGLDSDLEIQTRQTPWVNNPATTINTGLATVVDGNRVEFYVDKPLPLINNQSVFLEIGQSQALGQGSISRTSVSGYGVQGDLYTITYPNGDELKSAVFKDFLIDVTLDLAQTNSVVGLLGNKNGMIEDDLSLRDGTILINPLAPENLYGAFSSSWQVTENESLFSPISLDQVSTSSQNNDLAALANRYIFGGNGDDTLLGVNSTLLNPGKGEIDLFMGIKGADTFVLGDQKSSYYVGLGAQDYVLITDLWTEDRIQLHGSASDYVLGSAPTGLTDGTGIFLAQDSNELLGIIQGKAISSLDLSNPAIFHYV